MRSWSFCQGGVAMLAVLIVTTARAAEWPTDLNPVTFKPAPTHAPVVLVEKGQAKAKICLSEQAKSDRALTQAVGELVDAIEKSTGAKLAVVVGKVEPPAIVIGACAEAAAAGLVGAQMPIEGFAIKTAPNLVFIVGHDEGNLGGTPDTTSPGTAWGVYEFLERFVGVRWYWPTDRGGRSLVKADTLTVAPIHLEDAPAFRKREIWPGCGNPGNGTGQMLGPLHTALRSHNSWPILLRVHQPNWSKVKDYAEQRPTVFQQRTDGTRDVQMICYSNPRTLDTYLENIAAYYAGDKKAAIGISGNAITVSPNDMAVACYCADCRKLWDDAGGNYGTASKVIADFTQRLAAKVKERWPDKTVIVLPYMNYTEAPAGYQFAGNVEVQLCGMPGLAQYKEPSIRDAEQANLDRWLAISGRPVQNWHYSCWPEDKTKAPYQYAHVVRDYYRANRQKLVGTFINGVGDHWPRQHVTLYAWLKVLWNPDFNVDAAIDEYCRRMYGPATASVRELVQLELDGWEKSRWPGGRLSPKALYEVSYPKATVARMETLLKEARAKVADQPELLARVDYFATPFPAFFEEYRMIVEGVGARVLLVQKVAENPVVDGKLDDAAWAKATPVKLAKGTGKGEVEPLFATEAKAVFTLDGITLGVRCAEPAPDQLVRAIKSRDDSLAWWDDNLELFIDVTGKKEGDYYQFIVNPNGAIADFHEHDATWNVAGEKVGVALGDGFWSLEVYLPYAAFAGLVRPGTGVEWYGQLTRHRLGDYKTNKERPREYTRLNHKFGGPSNNLADFTAFRFVE